MPLASSAPTPTPPPSLKLRVFACLTKLSDRDTYASAAAELELIARGLDAVAFAPFISCIQSTDASDRSPVRKYCVRLLAVLSECHGDALAPHLNKILSAVVRRLRDPDSTVRSACVSAVESLRRHITKPPFVSFLKPLADALFTEQDQNSQIGAALCLAAAVESETDRDAAAARLAKLMPRLEKLLKCEGFKAKPALLSLIGSAIGVGGAGGEATVRTLLPCIAQVLSSDDWAARKSAAEALARLAVVERNGLSEFKAVNLKAFESRRFDKVKAVRDVMNQMLEVWKQIPDVSGEISPAPLQSKASSKGSRNSTGAEPEAKKRSRLPTRSTPPDSSYATTARKRTPLKCNDKKTGPVIKKPLSEQGDENIPETGNLVRPDTKRSLFHKNPGSRVAPLHEESRDSTVVVSNVTEDIHKNQMEIEDLSLIRNQLVQIEKQQSSLMDLLQRFIGSSQNGMRSLETRVHGLELALDEISYDLAVSSGRMSKKESPRAVCCMPGADFLSYKFWKRTESSRMTAPRVFTPGPRTTPSVIASRFREDASGGEAERFKLSRRFQLQGGGLIVNPLAELQSDSRG